MVASTLLLLMAPAFWTAPVINGGTHYLAPGAQARLAVTVSGGDAVYGLNLYVQIGDGGAANGGVHTAPTITAIDIIGPGTVFNGNNTGAQFFQAGNLIWSAQTTTDNNTVAASGTLAYIDVNTTGAAAGTYPLRLQGVYASQFPPGLATDFAGDPATIVDGSIVIVRPMTWNKAGDGNWTEAAWTGSPPAYPDASAAAIINTPRIVTVSAAQQAHSLSVSGGGTLSLASSGSLSLVNGLTLNGGTFSGSGTLAAPVAVTAGTFAAPALGDTLTLQGALSGAGPLTKAGAGTVVLAGTNTYAGGTTVGAGTLRIGNAAALPSGRALTIGSGATVVLQSGLSAAAGSAAAPVPEPGTLALLAAAILAGLILRRWKAVHSA